MYGQYNWLDRNGPYIYVPIPKFVSHLKTRNNKLKKCLDDLETWGLISYTWYKHYAKVSIVPPVGMEHTSLGEILDVK